MLYKWNENKQARRRGGAVKSVIAKHEGGNFLYHDSPTDNMSEERMMEPGRVDSLRLD